MSSDWKHDFKSFVDSDAEPPPSPLSQAILSRVKEELNPSLDRILKKLIPLQLLSGAVTLLFCPQLGVGATLFGPHGLVMPLFMPLGDLACAGLCGALYLGLSLAFSLPFFSKEEVRKISDQGYLYVTLLVAISFVGLMLGGGGGARAEYLIWLAGAGIGGWSAAKLSSRLRWRPYHRRLLS